MSRELIFYGGYRLCFWGESVQTSRPASGRARFSARTGVGESITKSCVQTKSAADARPCRLPAADGTRRGASYVPQTRIFAEPKRRATTGRPLPICCTDKAKASCRRHCRFTVGTGENRSFATPFRRFRSLRRGYPDTCGRTVPTHRHQWHRGCAPSAHCRNRGCA